MLVVLGFIVSFIIASIYLYMMRRAQNRDGRFDTIDCVAAFSMLFMSWWFAPIIALLNLIIVMILWLADNQPD